MPAVIRIGSSGFSYKEWLGEFYPAKLAGVRMLEYYADRLPTVEINYTFRALPRRAMLEGWVGKTSDNFRFALKAPQRITHFARLRSGGETLTYFLETAAALRNRLGPILFQLPPDMECDLTLLKAFLDQLGGRAEAAFEFRHQSWFNDAVYDVLRANQAALVIAESATIKTPIVRTASFAYLRLRMESYDDAALQRWASIMRGMANEMEAIYAFFKHEAAAPELAIRLASMVTLAG
jgi:uncharacterized protein YecE (DUF72 family)